VDAENEQQSFHFEVKKSSQPTFKVLWAPRQAGVSSTSRCQNCRSPPVWQHHAKSSAQREPSAPSKDIAEEGAGHRRCAPQAAQQTPLRQCLRDCAAHSVPSESLQELPRNLRGGCDRVAAPKCKEHEMDTTGADAGARRLLWC
jgi:hypothetical protein